MNTQLRNTELGRQLYNQLRLNLAFPGEVIAEVAKPYQPVNKWELTWDELMACPDMPTVARYRVTRETSMWFAIGVH